MAKKNEILLSISLDGDSEVKRKLVDVGEAGKRSLSDIDKRLGGAKNTFSGIQNAAGGLKEALAPLTAASGASGLLGGGILGGLLGRLNSPGGFLAGLGAAVSAALVGMAKLGEETQRTKGRLAALGDEKGFERTSERAKKLGVDASNLRPGLEQFRTFSQRVNAENETVIHPPGFKPGAAEEAASGVRIIGRGGQDLTPPSTPAFEKFNDALFTQVRRDVKTDDEAKAITDAFNKSVQTQGLTPDALRSLPPNAGSFLAAQMSKALSRNFANPEELAVALERNRVPPQNFSSVVNAGAAPAPEFEKAAQGSRGITQGAGAVSAALGRKLEETGGDHVGIGGFLDTAARQIDAFKPQQSPDEIFRQLLGAPQAPGASTLPAAPPKAQQTPDSIWRYLLGAPQQAPTAAPVVPPQAPVESPAFTDGRRYSRMLNPTDGQSNGLTALDASATETSESVKGFGAALAEVGAGIKTALGFGQSTAGSGNQAEPAKFAAGGPVRWLDDGGPIAGPGTTTSDSIPAMLSDKEFVMNARASSKIGLAKLDYMNKHGELPGYAGGGSVLPGLSGSYDVTATDDGGAIINGNYVPPSSPLLQDPIIKQALERSRRARGQDTGGGSKHKSDFVGLFGGHNFDTPGSFAKGGPVGSGLFARGRSISVPGFADGGAVADAVGWSGTAPSLSDFAPAGGGSSGHMDVDLRTNHGDFRMMASGEVARAMAVAARDSADVQTGPRPSWYRGK